ncbi:MAG: trigger factor [Flavobacteriaceae bacterium]|nr:trigger factor [Flavobacteriaceae bacterium]
MKFNRSNSDELNAVLTVTVDKADYADKVNDALKNYRKNANIPGFRKGQVPMSLIKKQYEMPLVYEEVNKLLQTGVDNYLRENKVEILGQPVPKEDKNFDWNADELNFSFDLGLAPQFELDLSKVSVPYYNIEVSEEDIDKYIENFASRYGKMSPADHVTEGAILKGVFHELNDNNEVEEGAEHYHASIRLNDIKQKDLFLEKKAEDKIIVDAQDLFEDVALLEETLGLEDASDFNKKLQFKINEIVGMQNAEINQELFDKVYGEGSVDSEEGFRQKIKEEAEKMYEGEADRVMLSAVLMDLVENSDFQLPKEFLKNWMSFNQKNENTPEELEESYNNSEKGFKYQLIEGKLADKFEISVTENDVMDKAVDMIKQQMAMYGINTPEMTDEQLKGIAMSSIKNEEEYNRLTNQVFSDKLLNVFKENIKFEEKKVSFDEFIEEVKKQNEKVNK